LDAVCPESAKFATLRLNCCEHQASILLSLPLFFQQRLLQELCISFLLEDVVKPCAELFNAALVTLQ
jgi:hypothetical protein